MRGYGQRSKTVVLIFIFVVKEILYVFMVREWKLIVALLTLRKLKYKSWIYHLT